MNQLKKVWCFMKKVLVFLSLIVNILAIDIPKEQLNKVADLIFKNEAGGKKEQLIAWNEGEEFLSLGIGHFIWYPLDHKGIFKESFPSLQEHLVKRGYILPKLLNLVDAPWNTKEEYLKSKTTDDFKAALDFLYETRYIQMELITLRAEKSLDEILKHTNKPDEVKKAFYEVFNSPFGIYPIIDYVNFKGEGIKESEAYNGNRWGLLQVLEYVADNQKNISPVEKFIEGGKFLLQKRVDNSPAERNEKKWIPGWFNRLETYRITK